MLNALIAVKMRTSLETHLHIAKVCPIRLSSGLVTTYPNCPTSTADISTLKQMLSIVVEKLRQCVGALPLTPPFYPTPILSTDRKAAAGEQDSQSQVTSREVSKKLVPPSSQIIDGRSYWPMK